MGTTIKWYGEVTVGMYLSVLGHLTDCEWQVIINADGDATVQRYDEDEWFTFGVAVDSGKNLLQVLENAIHKNSK